MNPTKKARPGTASGTGSKQVGETSTSVRLPTARANAGPPVRGRGLWAVTVLSCPVCAALHQHRAGDPQALLRGRLVRVCPTTGERYRLSPVRRWREARRG